MGFSCSFFTRARERCTLYAKMLNHQSKCILIPSYPSTHPTLLHHNEIMSFHTLVSWDWRKEERENTPREARGIRELSQSGETKERLVQSMHNAVKYLYHQSFNNRSSYPWQHNREERNAQTTSMEINHPSTLEATFLPPEQKPADADTGVEKEQPHLTTV